MLSAIGNALSAPWAANGGSSCRRDHSLRPGAILTTHAWLANSGQSVSKLSLYRQAGDSDGEANTLINLDEPDTRSGQYGSAGEHLHQALNLYRRQQQRRTAVTGTRP